MTETRVGRVTRGDARVYHVLLDNEIRTFAPRGKLFERMDKTHRNPVAVGDLVRVSLDGDPPGVEEVLPRENWLPRIGSSHDPRQQILVANVDQLFIVGSMTKPRFSSNRTDRILATCEYYEIPAVLILNKADLDPDGERDAIRETYERAGIEVLETIATDGTGVPELAERLVGKISVFYGASGAGKSTLINAIDPSLHIKTGKISRYWDTGKHTTTYSQMHRVTTLEDAWIIDTPGIRVFRPAGINQAELRDLFPEFAPFAANCRFTTCSHGHEPGCAVFEAVDAGELSPTRYASYVEILDELSPPPEDDPPVPPPDEDP